MFSGPESSITVPAFLAKLWKMVCEPKYDELISWSESGSSFVIKDQSRFCSELLPSFYKHNNMASFIRQLNKYGFRKVVSVNSSSLKGDVSDFEFYHPHFIKGWPSLLDQIKRKVSHSKDISEVSSDLGLMPTILQELEQLKQKGSVVDSRLDAMKAENNALWREYSILRQRNQKQQKIINRLINFLVSLVHRTRGVNLKRRNMPLMLKDGACLPIDSLATLEENPSGSQSPIIYEISPSEVITSKGTIQSKSFHDSTNIKAVGNGKMSKGSDVGKSILSNSDNIIINIPSQPTIALPLQEVAPSLTVEPNLNTKTKHATKNPLIIKGKPAEKRKLSLPNEKSIRKVRKIIPKVQNCAQVVPSSSNTKVNLLNYNPKVINKKVGNPIILTGKTATKKFSSQPERNNSSTREDVKITDKGLNNSSLLRSESPLEIEYDIPDISIFDNNLEEYVPEEQNNLLATQPIVFSPEGTQIHIPEQREIKQENTNTSLILSDSAVTKEDVENHLDLMESDLDTLKEMLHGEGLSLDASTIMDLFANDDPISLNMPEAGRTIDGSKSPTGNELVSYNNPIFIDIAGATDGDELRAADPSFIDEISLNTPEFILPND